ncbi:MAG TPA: M14 metallopeptidase family protein, partial [Acidobacteriota bacterium]|nr:M14 metallopeptidase family protein [Acidobacteriota bacterium]
MKKISGIAISALLLISFSQAGRLPFALDHDVEGVTYSDVVPTPEETLGHVIGSRHTLPHQVVDYFREVAARSDRVLLREHGRTYENRPLIHAIISSPENLARVESIRLANLRLSDPSAGVTDKEIESMPAIVYLGFSIHGNEASGTEASLLLLYHLTAGSGPPVDPLLENLVILIDPSFNPDGRSRFAEWVNANRGGVATTDLQDREHNEPWPGGRTNHYWFDLNRDWLPARHRESRARVELFHHWRPQYLADFHEMDRESTFFFQPGVPERTNPQTPARNQELTERLAEFHVRHLDRIGSLYYARETFDDFYYGKGSTYPDLNGAVGVLFEQASSRSLKTTTTSGELTYPFTIRNQFTAALSSLEGVHALRRDFLTYQRDFYAEMNSVFQENDVKAYLLDASDSPQRTRMLVELMQLHQIQIYRLNRDVEIDGQLYRKNRDLIVPLNQPQIRLIKTVMERVTEFKDSVFYDISAWTLPLAFGIRHAALEDDRSLPIGPEWNASQEQPGGVHHAPAKYAYLLPWDHYMAPAALYQLQNAGINCRLLKAPLTTRSGEIRREFDRGTLIIPVVQQALEPETVHSAVQQAAQDFGVVFYGVDSGWTEEGPALGSPSSLFIEK